MAAHVVVSLWRTLALALFAATLGVYIYFVERPRVADEAAGDVLVKVTPKDVQSVTLRYAESPAIRLERDGTSWHLREPIDFPADDAVVDRLVEQIAETKVERHIKQSEAQALSVYGLEGDGEHARISIVTAGGAKVPDIIVGRTTPVGYSAFARLDGSDEIVVTPLIFHTGIKKSVLELRKKRLFEVDVQQVIAMRLTDAGRTIELERRGDEWLIKSPIEARADAEQARGLVAALNELQAIDFLDAPPAAAAATPALEFRATLAEGGDIGFRLRPLDPNPPATYFLERDGDGLLAKVEESAKVRFTKDVGTLRDKRLFLCEADDAAEIRFDRADGGGFALVRSGDAWTLKPPPTDGTVRDSVVRRTVTGLVALAGKDVAMENASTPEDLAGFGLDTPVVEVEILKQDGASCGRALAGVKGADGATPAYYAKRSDAGLVMTLPSYLYSRIDVRRDDLVEKKPAAAASPPAPSDAAPAR